MSEMPVIYIYLSNLLTGYFAENILQNLNQCWKQLRLISVYKILIATVTFLFSLKVNLGRSYSVKKYKAISPSNTPDLTTLLTLYLQKLSMGNELSF